MMRGIFRLRIVLALMSGLMVIAGLSASPAYSRSRRRKAEATPTPVPTPSPSPTPEAKVWNFDRDKPHQAAQGWTAVDGDWQVLSDPTAPSQPNVLGLPPGREVKSLTSGLTYSVFAVVSDPTEYSNFTLEASFKAKKGWFDCSGGLIIRYADPKNYYLMEAGCPSDYFGLYRISGGKAEVLKQTVVPTDQNVWYQLKVIVDGDHFTCYQDKKMAFDATDNKIAKGRIGVWALNDSQPEFDNVTLTLSEPAAPSEAAPEAAPSAPAGAPAAPPSMPSGPAAPPSMPH